MTEKYPEVVPEKPVQIVSSKLRSGTACRQIFISFFVNITALSSGMSLGFPAISLSQLTDPNNPVSLTESQGSWFASVNAIACPFGGLIASYILDKCGRKVTLIIINVISIVAWSISAFANSDSAEKLYTQLLISRFLLGIAAGLTSSPISVYAAEIAHQKLRGRLIVFTSIAISTGVLLIYFLGFIMQDDWRKVSLCAGLICLLGLIVTVFIPESPHWLARKNKLKRAEQSFNKINGRGNNEIEAMEKQRDLEQLLDHCRKPQKLENQKSESLWTKLKRPEVYKPLGIVLAYFTFQQLSGVFAIVVYIGQFSKAAGVSIDRFLFIVIGGVVRVTGTAVGAFLADSLGRRKPSIISGLGITVTMFGTALCMAYPSDKTSWIAAALILSYVLVNSVGFLVVPFALVAELYPQYIRGFAAGISVCYVYAISFVAIKFYPLFNSAVGPETVCLFIGSVSLLGTLFIYWFLPETKGRTFKEIEEFFKKK